MAFLPTSRDYRQPEAGAPDEAGGVILLRTAQSQGIWGGDEPPRSVEELFARAAAGERTAAELVEEESRRIAVFAASISAVADPEATILTGAWEPMRCSWLASPTSSKTSLPSPPRCCGQGSEREPVSSAS